MKHLLQTLSLGLLMATLSSCYVEGQGRVNSSRSYPTYGPWHGNTHTDHYYYERGPSYRPSGPLLNANTNLGLSL